MNAYLTRVQHGLLVVKAHKSAACPVRRHTVRRSYMPLRKPAVSRIATKPALKPAVCATTGFAGHAGGDGAGHPDNLAAMDASYAAGVRVEEEDIQFYDGTPYLHHDPITDPAGLDTVQAFADWLAAHPDVTALPEVKAPTLTGDEWATLTAILTPVRSQVTIASFYAADTQAARANGFASALIWSTASPSSAATPAEVAAEGATVEAAAGDLTPAVMAALHAAGVTTVYAWTTDTPAAYAALPAGAVPMGDYPTQYAAWRRVHCA